MVLLLEIIIKYHQNPTYLEGCYGPWWMPGLPWRKLLPWSGPPEGSRVSCRLYGAHVLMKNWGIHHGKIRIEHDQP